MYGKKGLELTMSHCSLGLKGMANKIVPMNAIIALGFEFVFDSGRQRKAIEDVESKVRLDLVY